MSRHLYLIRHAQTLEKIIQQTDLERELTSKGRNDATELGNFLFDQKIKLDIILTSPAVRTQTTARQIAESLFLSTEKIITISALYHAHSEDMLTITKGIKNEFQHVALIGHNPTISAFASNLTKKNVDGFSPCTLAVFQFTVGNWSDITPKSGNLLFSWQPDQIN
jgi:phosphohistidine phosphatase